LTATLVTFAVPTVPEPPETVQVCPNGWAKIVTEYPLPEVRGVAKVNAPLAAIASPSVPLFCSTSPAAASPLTVPPMVNRGGGLPTQATVTLVTFALPTVPEPPETEQVCPDGWLETVTAYELPETSGVAKVNGPLAVTARSSPPLFRRTRPG